MELNITTVTAPKKNIPFIFFLFERDVLHDQSLFKFLTVDEKKYVEQIKKDFAPLKEKEVRVLFMPVTRRKVILVGMGKEDDFSVWKGGLFTRIAVQTARKEKLTELAFFVTPFETPEATREFYEVVATNAVMANFEFVKYKTPPPEGFIFLKEIQAVAAGSSKAKSSANIADIKIGFERGIVIGEEVNRCRELSNTPGGDMTPVHLAARLKLKKNIVALVPAVENMLSGTSYRPGDLLRTMSGKTIEVMNTDAEGRVILADALEYAKKYTPSLVVDVATLTGASVVALGMRYSALFTPDKKLEEQFRAMGEATGDPVWPLPLSKDYEDDIRGTFGDWSNTGKKGVGGGASTAATFLWQFAKDAKGVDSYPWIHIDIAPRMTTIEGEYLAKGAAGAPVRLLVRFLESQ